MPASARSACTVAGERGGHRPQAHARPRPRRTATPNGSIASREPVQARALRLDRVPSSTSSLSRNPAMTRERATFLARAWTRPSGDGASRWASIRAIAASARCCSVAKRRRPAGAASRRPCCCSSATSRRSCRASGPDGGDEYFHSLYRDLRIVHVPEAGHMMHLEVPELLARHIVEFACHALTGGAGTRVAAAARMELQAPPRART